MKIPGSLLVGTLCISTAAGTLGQSAHEKSEAEAQITNTLRQMYEAEKRRDLKSVLSHLAEDFAEVAGDGGVYHRSDVEAGWNDVSVKDYQLSDCIFNLTTRDSAYLDCKMEVDATYKGQPLPPRFRVTTMWTRHRGEWLIRFEQGTIIPERKETSPKK